MELYSRIKAQKKACNDLLQKRNDLIAILESEIQDSDNQYKTLIEEYHENTSVVGSRMEAQIQGIIKYAQFSCIFAQFSSIIFPWR